MRIEGMWNLQSDGMTRPIILGEIEIANGIWNEVTFLVDSGADRTVLSNDVLSLMQCNLVEPSWQLEGIGGIADSVGLDSKIQLTTIGGNKVVFKGQFSAF